MISNLFAIFKRLLYEDGGATTAEYAVIILAMILTTIFVIYSMANWDGDGLLQVLFQGITNLIGSFGNIP